MKLFILHPGHVRSKTDGQWHYVGARRLADLYGVPWHECIDASRPGALLGIDQDDFIHLTPRRDGDYQRIVSVAFE